MVGRRTRPVAAWAMRIRSVAGSAQGGESRSRTRAEDRRRGLRAAAGSCALAPGGLRRTATGVEVSISLFSCFGKNKKKNVLRREEQNAEPAAGPAGTGVVVHVGTALAEDRAGAEDRRGLVAEAHCSRAPVAVRCSGTAGCRGTVRAGRFAASAAARFDRVRVRRIGTKEEEGGRYTMALGGAVVGARFGMGEERRGMEAGRRGTPAVGRSSCLRVVGRLYEREAGQIPSSRGRKPPRTGRTVVATNSWAATLVAVLARSFRSGAR